MPAQAEDTLWRVGETGLRVRQADNVVELLTAVDAENLELMAARLQSGVSQSYSGAVARLGCCGQVEVEHLGDTLAHRRDLAEIEPFIEDRGAEDAHPV